LNNVSLKKHWTGTKYEKKNVQHQSKTIFFKSYQINGMGLILYQITKKIMANFPINERMTIPCVCLEVL